MQKKNKKMFMYWGAECETVSPGVEEGKRLVARPVFTDTVTGVPRVRGERRLNEQGRDAANGQHHRLSPVYVLLEIKH